MDKFSSEVRSKIMAKIKNKDTQIEMHVRSFLYKNKIAYRLHDKRFVGKPDIYVPKHKTIIFINGCFWHAHGCGACKIPLSNVGFWETKLKKNVLRDQKNIMQLKSESIKVIVIWGCAFGSKSKINDELFDKLINKALKKKKLFIQIVGNSKRLKGKKVRIEKSVEDLMI